MNERIRYYDLSTQQENSDRTTRGEEIFVDDLLDMKAAANPEVFRHYDMLNSVSHYDFDPWCLKKTSHWERVVRTMIFSVSRQIASREELKKGRQIIERLPKGFKQNVGRDFVINFLPYLLIGFNTHRGSSFVNELNSIDNACSFIEAVYQKYQTYTISFLCAHREATAVKPHSLVDNIVMSKATKTINLQHALFANALIETASLSWHQQLATERASSNMFPEIFLSYLNRVEVPDMLLQLDRHTQQMEKLIQQLLSSGIEHRLKPLDIYSVEFENYLEEEFGIDWRSRRIQFPTTISEVDWNYLTKIVQVSAFPEVERFMPYFLLNAHRGDLIQKGKIQDNIQRAILLEEQGQKLTSGFSLADVTQNAIDWFNTNMNINAETKALYEVMFYYYWGLISRENNFIGIGIERDYTRYQDESWALGYNKKIGVSAIKRGVPLLYSRRTPKELEMGTLRDISFRQFWRNT